jgi:hypothetical protein
MMDQVSVGGQAAIEVGPSEPLYHEPPTEERILTMDYAATQAWSLGPLLPPHNQWAIDKVDWLYCQLTEIHEIGAAQLAKCAWWSHSDTNPSPIRFRTNRRSPNGMPSSTRTVHYHQSSSPIKLRYGSKGHVTSPWHASGTGRRAHDPNGARRTRAVMSPVDRGDKASTPRGQWQE